MKYLEHGGRSDTQVVGNLECGKQLIAILDDDLRLDIRSQTLCSTSSNAWFFDDALWRTLHARNSSRPVGISPNTGIACAVVADIPVDTDRLLTIESQ